LAYEPGTETVFTTTNSGNRLWRVTAVISPLGGQDLHDDDDGRELRIITDDERPFGITANASDTTEDDK